MSTDASAARNDRVAVRRATAAALVVTVLSVAAVWWVTLGTIPVLGAGGSGWWCAAVYPAPASCGRGWHVRVAAVLSVVVALLGAGAAWTVRRTRHRVAPIVVLGLAGLLAWAIAIEPTRVAL